MKMVKIKFLEKEVFYKTKLSEKELLIEEYQLKDIPFDEIEQYIDNNDIFSRVESKINNYDYIISLLDDELVYIVENFSHDKTRIKELEKVINQRDNIINGVIEMYDSNMSSKPIV